VEKYTTHNSKNRPEFCCFPKREKFQDCVCIAIIFLQRARKVAHEVGIIQLKKLKIIFSKKIKISTIDAGFRRAPSSVSPKTEGKKIA